MSLILLLVFLFCFIPWVYLYIIIPFKIINNISSDRVNLNLKAENESQSFHKSKAYFKIYIRVIFAVIISFFFASFFISPQKMEIASLWNEIKKSPHPIMTIEDPYVLSSLESSLELKEDGMEKIIVYDHQYVYVHLPEEAGVWNVSVKQTTSQQSNTENQKNIKDKFLFDEKVEEKRWGKLVHSLRPREFKDYEEFSLTFILTNSKKKYQVNLIVKKTQRPVVHLQDPFEQNQLLFQDGQELNFSLKVNAKIPLTKVYLKLTTLSGLTYEKTISEFINTNQMDFSLPHLSLSLSGIPFDEDFPGNDGLTIQAVALTQNNDSIGLSQELSYTLDKNKQKNSLEKTENKVAVFFEKLKQLYSQLDLAKEKAFQKEFLSFFKNSQDLIKRAETINEEFFQTLHSKAWTIDEKTLEKLEGLLKSEKITPSLEQAHEKIADETIPSAQDQLMRASHEAEFTWSQLTEGLNESLKTAIEKAKKSVLMSIQRSNRLNLNQNENPTPGDFQNFTQSSELLPRLSPELLEAKDKIAHAVNVLKNKNDTLSRKTLLNELVKAYELLQQAEQNQEKQNQQKQARMLHDQAAIQREQAKIDSSWRQKIIKEIHDIEENGNSTSRKIIPFLEQQLK